MIIVIAGATGSGKSHLAVELAKRIGGEVINADAFQVYKELSIATAKPSKEMREAVPHHLFDFVPLDEEYNVYRYQQDLRRTLNEVISRGKTPIIAGGTGLYIRAGLFDYEFGETEKPDMSKYEAMSDEELYQALKDIDEESAASIHPHNRVRVKRAIEIYLSSGKKKSEIIKEQKHEPIYPVKFFGLKPERDELYQKVESRVDEMFEMGLVEEGVALIKKYGTSPRAFRAIGVKELFPYLEGKATLDDVKDEIKKNTRHYVKRQDTFFAHQFSIQWVSSLEEILSSSL